MPTGVAEKLSGHTYSTQKWKVFFEALCFIYEIERQLESQLTLAEEADLNQKCVKFFQSNSISGNFDDESQGRL